MQTSTAEAFASTDPDVLAAQRCEQAAFELLAICSSRFAGGGPAAKRLKQFRSATKIAELAKSLTAAIQFEDMPK